MIEAVNITVAYGARTLFDGVSAKFTPGNCYGLIGANGAGKSTFLKVLAGEVDPQAGHVGVAPDVRLSVLRQDHFALDEVEVISAVLMGQERLWAVMQERDAIYAKGELSDADGLRVADLEADFAAMNGWSADSDAGLMLSGLGLGEPLHGKKMRELSDNQKLRVLLAQALFGDPDVLLLDEPTNHLDVQSILWLENFLADFKQTVIVVSHDRHFLDNVCTHIADIDFGTLRLYTGNYAYWYEASQLALQQKQDRNKKAEDKAKELKTFIARFSANASKSKQATSRKKLLGKLGGEHIPPSTRRYPHIVFRQEKPAGKDMVAVTGLDYDGGLGRTVRELSFRVHRGDRLALMGDEGAPVSTLLGLLGGALTPKGGEIRWGASCRRGFFPKDHDAFFAEPLALIDWLRQYSQNKDETFVRGFLGKMLFTRDESLKPANVLSGGEKVRCMFARLMMEEPNVLILDGPTNHLDLESITALNDALLAYDGTLIFASQDVQFVESLARRVLYLDGERLVGDFADYPSYAASLAPRQAQTTARAS